MTFDSRIYLLFLVIIFSLYWWLANKNIQNVLLLIASYIFYGFVHPWFCLLIATSTIVDYFCGIGIYRKRHKKLYLMISICANLGILGFFKYFDFFADNFRLLLQATGFQMMSVALDIFLPVGISFYTFQTLSYTIDIFREKLTPRKNFVDFALFVSFFPQLVAGPIERATNLLPQIESRRSWCWNYLSDGFSLFLHGYLKKLVVADNIAIFVDKIFLLDSPPFSLLFLGAFAFAIQIYADFSAYTDIARGSAKLFGFDLMENFKAPYLAISPSDFWRRWHISFSSWIRDYLYISLGGSRVSRVKFLFIVLISMGLSGLWHGAAWHFILWGIFHGLLLFFYHLLGIGGRWHPQGKISLFFAWLMMSCFTLFGWLIFRSGDLAWLVAVLSRISFGLSGDYLVTSVTILAFVIFYSLPLLIVFIVEKYTPDSDWIQAMMYCLELLCIMILHRDANRDFIYFQF